MFLPMILREVCFLYENNEGFKPTFQHYKMF